MKPSSSAEEAVAAAPEALPVLASEEDITRGARRRRGSGEEEGEVDV